MKLFWALGLMVTILLAFFTQIIRFIFDIGAFTSRTLLYADFVLSFLLGLFVAGLGIVMFGEFKRKVVLFLTIIVLVSFFIFYGMYDYVFALFLFLGVLIAMISQFEELMRSWYSTTLTDLIMYKMKKK